MKKTLFIGLVLLVGANLTDAKVDFGCEAAKKEDFVPYYMRNTDSSKIDAVKTNQAGCDDGCDCSGSSNKSVLPAQTFIDLKKLTQKNLQRH